MLNCQEILCYLMKYLDGELSPEESARFEKHIAICPPCIDYMKTYKETIRLGQSVCHDETSACAEVPEELIQAILAMRRQP